MFTSAELAFKLGNQRMFKHVLSRRAVILWRWGPVTQYKLDLEGIESAGDSGTDVMELIDDPGTTPSALKMLLDDFMQGFLHTLFLRKWHVRTPPANLSAHGALG